MMKCGVLKDGFEFMRKSSELSLHSCFAVDFRFKNNAGPR